MGADLEDQAQDLRERILDATLRVIRERGMARTRTNAIARAAGCSEGSIYRYFTGKPELLHEVARTRLRGLIDLLADLPGLAGSATVQANLLDVVREASAFYGGVMPLYAGVVADAELFAEQRELFVQEDLGPRRAAGALGAYLRAEQRLGRVRPNADPAVAARLILAGCLGESFVCALLDRRADEVERDRHARAFVEMVMSVLEPSGGGPP